jgi:hypothetical protein
MRRLVKRVSMAVGLMAVAMPALAHDHGWKHKRHHHFPPGHIYYVERPVVIVPARPVYYERPMYYGYDSPMYYGPPAPPSININIPLN